MAEDFIGLLKKEFAERCIATERALHSPVMSRIRPIEEAFDPNSTGIALQVQATDADALRRYTETILPELLAFLHARWGLKVMFFTSVLDVISF